MMEKKWGREEIRGTIVNTWKQSKGFTSDITGYWINLYS